MPLCESEITRAARTQSGIPVHLREENFSRWWDDRLARYRGAIEDLSVEIDNPLKLSANERHALAARVRDTNMAIYRCRQPGNVDRAAIQALTSQLGLGKPDSNLCAADDGLSELEVNHSPTHQRYIPYSNRPIGWHTDGYYHTPERTIRAMTLHCVRPAISDGTLQVIDHEIVFGLLHRCDPRYTMALSQSDTMTIPANEAAGSGVRASVSGPVFSHNGDVLQMRYSARKRNIIWKNDSVVREAIAALQEILDSCAELAVTHRLLSGEGLVCNNVPHRRDGFTDSSQPECARLIYRGRYTQALTTMVLR
ncbi:TauD/TfdA family dioxygenase [Gammaproteobacteria bacterium]|nr:TauD/TfdA family dioxygenase [Gammaproteobacteria bacterium]